jgi:hypothetical protein
MNTRWRSTAPTDEDLDVLGFRMYVGPGRLQFIGTLHALGTQQDRSDAELMLEAQQIARFGPCPMQLYGIECRGWSVGSLKLVNEL